VTERRRNQEQRALATTLVGLLASRPDLNEVARLVVALLSGPLSIRGGALVAAHDGEPRLLGHWLSIPPGVEGADRLRQNLLDASIDALQGSVVLPAGDGTVGIPLAAWPLGPAGQPLAALVVVLDPPVDASRVRSCLAELADVLAIYVAGVQQGAEDARPGPEPVPLLPGPVALTDRQHAVLALLAQGLTMRAIGARIGFSDSTVRSESLAIYRALGVHDRDHAVARARILGLLAEPHQSVGTAALDGTGASIGRESMAEGGLPG
jgi:DNA-binding CsgD family transcriptional regulator